MGVICGGGRHFVLCVHRWVIGNETEYGVILSTRSRWRLCRHIGGGGRFDGGKKKEAVVEEMVENTKEQKCCQVSSSRGAKTCGLRTNVAAAVAVDGGNGGDGENATDRWTVEAK